jgi:hypothetical protein
LKKASFQRSWNHVAAVALHYMHYNYVRIHKTLRVTAAMAAGRPITFWDVEEIVARLDAREEAA